MVSNLTGLYLTRQENNFVICILLELLNPNLGYICRHDKWVEWSLLIVKILGSNMVYFKAFVLH